MVLSAFAISAGAANDSKSRVLVTFKDQVDEKLIEDNNGKVEKKFTNFAGAVTHLSGKDITALKKSDKVDSVELDRTVSVLAKPDKPGKPPKDPPTPPPEYTPWGVEMINADDLWPSKATGSGVSVAILDTGIDTNHPDLPTIASGNGINYIPKKGKVDPTNFEDDAGHGTHVAGTIAAIDNDEGVQGAAHGANLLIAKVLNKRGVGWQSDFTDAIYWAVDKGANVISMSLGGTGYISEFKNACDFADLEGVVVVAAAGNSGTTNVLYPAAFPSVLAISATTSLDTLASFSTYGSEIQFAAPGVSIPSTYKGGGYQSMSGTSMACPHVAAAFALMLEDKAILGTITIESALQNKAVDLGPNGKDIYFGYGRIDVLAAYDTAYP